MHPAKPVLKAIGLLGSFLFISETGFAQTATQPQQVPDTVYTPVAGGGQVFSSVDHPPEYPGGQEALITFLASNVRYPFWAKKEGVQGRVIAQFVVDKTGKITNIEIKKKLRADCDREVVRVIKSMPLWKPGVKEGKPVNVYYTLPISFKIDL